MNKNIIKFTTLIVIIIAIVGVIQYYNLGQYFNQETLEKTIESFGIWAPAIFILLYMIATIAFLPGAPLSIAAGILFGALLGTLYIVIGASIGAILAFIVARYFGGDFVQNLMQNHFKGLKKYEEKLDNNGLGMTLFFRLIPIFPFNGLNFALGLTKLSFKDYAIGTTLGIIPGAFAFAYFGQAAANLSPVDITLASVLLGLLIFAQPLYNYIRKKMGKKNEI